MLFAAQQLRLLLESGKQRHHVHHFVMGARWRGLQFRQHEQIVHQPLHAQGLLLHGREVFFQLLRAYLVHVPQGLDETAEHGEWRAQFVRDIGDEITAHLLETRQTRDVAPDDEFLQAAERRYLDRNVNFAVIRRVDFQQFGIVAALEILNEVGIAQQIEQAHAGIARVLDAEQARGGGIGPLDIAVLGQDDHGIRHGRGGALEPSQHLVQLFLAEFRLLHELADFVEHVAPQAFGVGDFRLLAVEQPVMQALQLAHRKKDVKAETDGGDRGRDVR